MVVFSIEVGNNFEINSLLFFDPFFDDPYPCRWSVHVNRRLARLRLLIFGRGGPTVVVGVGRVGLSLKELNPTIIVSAYDQLIICFETKLSKIASSSRKSYS